MLKGLKVLQFQGLAPSVWCSMYFSDQGAQVILVTRPQPNAFSLPIHKNIMNRNKKSISLSLKQPKDREMLSTLISQVDIVIDPLRPGVLEKEGFGPEELAKINPRLVFLRVTGYGQKGSMALRPGHDINYISSSGMLNIMNKQGQYQFPANYTADFVSASLGVLNTLLALRKRQTTKVGYIVDCSLADGCSYLTYLVQQNKQLSKTEKQQQVQFYEQNQKRYVITTKDKQKITDQRIGVFVRDMQKQDKQYFKNKQLQIAQIIQIKGAKQSNLTNAFDQIAYVSNYIPKRNQNRQYILQKYKLLNLSKL